jgi:glutamate carboxypeptidase
MRAVHEQRDAYVDFLCRLAEMESPSTDPQAQAGWQDLLGSALAGLDFDVEHLPGEETGGCLYARARHGETGDAPYRLLLGHGDTVWDHGTIDRMPVTVSNGRVHGPGVFDMKAGLTSIVFALRALRRLGAELPATPVVLVTSDEEIGSPESKRHIQRLAAAAERAYVLEPALGLDGKIKTTRKGTGDLEIVVRAPSGDAASGTAGGDASNEIVLELSRLVQKLHAFNDPESGVTVNVGTIDAGRRNGVAEGRLSIDVRVPTGDDAERISGALREVEASTPGLELEVLGGMDRPPMEETPRNRQLWQRARRLGRTLGLDLEEGRSGGASDGNYTSQYTATLDGLGAVGDGAHATHEYVEIDATLNRCALLALLLLDEDGG